MINQMSPRISCLFAKWTRCRPWMAWHVSAGWVNTKEIMVRQVKKSVCLPPQTHVFTAPRVAAFELENFHSAGFFLFWIRGSATVSHQDLIQIKTDSARLYFLPLKLKSASFLSSQEGITSLRLVWSTLMFIPLPGYDSAAELVQ